MTFPQTVGGLDHHIAPAIPLHPLPATTACPLWWWRQQRGWWAATGRPYFLPGTGQLPPPTAATAIAMAIFGGRICLGGQERDSRRRHCGGLFFCQEHIGEPLPGPPWGPVPAHGPQVADPWVTISDTVQLKCFDVSQTFKDKSFAILTKTLVMSEIAQALLGFWPHYFRSFPKLDKVPRFSLKTIHGSISLHPELVPFSLVLQPSLLNSRLSVANIHKFYNKAANPE